MLQLVYLVVANETVLLKEKFHTIYKKLTINIYLVAVFIRKKSLKPSNSMGFHYINKKPIFFIICHPAFCWVCSFYRKLLNFQAAQRYIFVISDETIRTLTRGKEVVLNKDESL